MRAGGDREAAAGLQVTVSVGVAQADGSTDLKDPLQRADDALYAAKSSGRNRVCLWKGAAPA